jgi:hypothetical protein
MADILSHGYLKAISLGQFLSLPDGYPIGSMKTVFETRRDRLKELIEKYGSIAAVNTKLGWDATSARLSQIQNRSIRSDRGTPYEMGDTTAREIEQKLSLETGWMDTPVGYADMSDQRIGHVIKVMEAMPEWQREQAVKIVDTLAQPAPGNGTTG